jgi:hypothetical protein
MKAQDSANKVARNQYIQIAAFRKEVADLKAEIEKLKAKPAQEIHYHYHTQWYRDLTIPYVQPPYVPYTQPYPTYTSQKKNLFGDGNMTPNCQQIGNLGLGTQNYGTA